YPRRYSTDRATKPQGKTASARRVAALLACGFVARRVTERCGYAPLLASRHKPKSPATNCILSHGLVSMSADQRGPGSKTDGFFTSSFTKKNSATTASKPNMTNTVVFIV